MSMSATPNAAGESSSADGGSVVGEPVGSAPLMVSVSGCRGIVGESLTPVTIARYAGAIAEHLRRKAGDGPAPVVLAVDGRASGAMVGDVVSGALQAAGCRVIDLGVATTPTAGVMVGHHHAAGAVVVTASHNPQQWNGLKAISAGACAPPRDDAEEIGRLFREGGTRWASHEAMGSVEADDTAAHVHVARVLDAVERIAPLDAIRGQSFRVVVDSVNGSGSRGARLLLEALGCQPTFIHDSSSGVFPHAPEPLAENLGELAAQTAAQGAAVGFAQDPDADRLALVDSRGRYIGEEYTLALSAMSYLDALPAARRDGVKLATNLSTSRMIEDVAEQYGATVRRTAVGEANLVEWMAPNGSPLGGEGNGGVIWPEVVPIRDSLSAMALVLALMARTGATLADLVDDLPRYAIVKRKVDFDGGMLDRLEPALTSAFAGSAVDTTDGVRLDLTGAGGGKAWLHVRASNTEPIVRLIAEAPSAERAESLLDEAAAALT